MHEKLLKHLLAAIVLCYTIACLPSCKKPEPEYHYVSKELKEYFDWKVGTYWVFYDSVAGKVDSVSVVGYAVNSPEMTGSRGEENVAFVMEGYYRGAGYDSCSWNFILSSSNSVFLSIKKVYSLLAYNKFMFNIPFYVGSYPSGDATHPTIVSTFYPTLNIGGNTYYDVYKIHFTYQNTQYYDTYYINKDYGIVAVFLKNELFNRRLYLLKSRKAL